MKRLLALLLLLPGLALAQTPIIKNTTPTQGFTPGSAITAGSNGRASEASSFPASSLAIGTPLTGGITNGLLFNDANTVGNLASGNNGVLVTNGSGVPSISSTLPNGLAMGTPTALTLTNATGLPNSGLLNSSMTIAGHSVSLGGTQAIACGDLSNGATGCSTAIGTSDATIPLLNGTNTWSALQTFSMAAVNGSSFTSGPITCTCSISGTTLTVASPSAINISYGMSVTGVGVAAGTYIVQFLSGSSGGAGTYQVNNSQTVGSENMTIQGTSLFTVNNGGLAIINGTIPAVNYYGVDLEIQRSDLHGATMALGGRYAGGPASAAYLQLTNNVGDQEGVIQLFNDQYSGGSLFFKRALLMAVNYGNFIFEGNYQGATPVTFYSIGGCINGSNSNCNDQTAGYFSIGSKTFKDMLSVFGRTNTEAVASGIYRTDGNYGFKTTVDGASGNTTMSLVGSGATLTVPPHIVGNNSGVLINSTDLISMQGNTNGTQSFTLRNSNAGASTLDQFCFGNSSSPCDGYISFTNAANSGLTGQGARGMALYSVQAMTFYSNGAQALTLDTSSNTTVEGTLSVKGITSVATTSAVCVNTSTGLLTYDGTLGTCNTSALWAKTPLEHVQPKSMLTAVASIEHFDSWKYKQTKENRGQFDERVHVGLYADDVEKMDKRCVGYKDGRIANYEDRCVIAYLAGAIKELKAANDNLLIEVNTLKKRVK